MNDATMNRRKAIAAFAVAPAALAALPALGLGNDATEGDVELRKLWAEYLAQLDAYRKTDVAHSERREALEDDLGLLPWGGWPDGVFQEASDRLGYGPVYEAWGREGEKLTSITREIRKAKAKTLFGVGVKLSVVGGDDDEQDIVDAAKDALKAIGEITGFDFAAATDGGLA